MSSNSYACMYLCKSSGLNIMTIASNSYAYIDIYARIAVCIFRNISIALLGNVHHSTCADPGIFVRGVQVTLTKKL